MTAPLLLPGSCPTRSSPGRTTPSGGMARCSSRRIPSVWTSSWRRPSSTAAPRGPPPAGAPTRTTTTTRSAARSERQHRCTGASGGGWGYTVALGGFGRTDRFFQTPLETLRVLSGTFCWLFFLCCFGVLPFLKEPWTIQKRPTEDSKCGSFWKRMNCFRFWLSFTTESCVLVARWFQVSLQQWCCRQSARAVSASHCFTVLLVSSNQWQFKALVMSSYFLYNQTSPYRKLFGTVYIYSFVFRISPSQCK